MYQVKKHIEFTKAATAAFHSLNASERRKASSLLEALSEDISSPILQNKFYKLANSSRELYALRLSMKLRMVVEILEDELKVLDILNHDLFTKYFDKVV